MGLIGNIGGIEREAGPETRIAIEKLDRRLGALERTSATIVQNNTVIIRIPGEPTGQPLPLVVNLPYPFVIPPSAHLYPTGLDLIPGIAYRVTRVEMLSDPDGPAAGSNTTFTVQNHGTAPTSSGTVTFLSGTRRATATMNVLIGAGERIYIKAPSLLNYITNLYVIALKLEE